MYDKKYQRHPYDIRDSRINKKYARLLHDYALRWNVQATVLGRDVRRVLRAFGNMLANVNRLAAVRLIHVDVAGRVVHHPHLRLE